MQVARRVFGIMANSQHYAEVKQKVSSIQIALVRQIAGGFLLPGETLATKQGGEALLISRLDAQTALDGFGVYNFSIPAGTISKNYKSSSLNALFMYRNSTAGQANYLREKSFITTSFSMDNPLIVTFIPSSFWSDRIAAWEELAELLRKEDKYFCLERC